MRAALFFTLILIGNSAAAFDFQSPSGNIHCIMTSDGAVDVRCDRLEFEATLPRPADCDLDWGVASWVGETGRGAAACAGDTAYNPKSSVLQYGMSIEANGLRCTSERTGMTCRNRDGGGFRISRTRQDVF